jgi:hypothetical protein
LQQLAAATQTLREAEDKVHRGLDGGEPIAGIVAASSRASHVESIYTGIEGVLKELLASMGETVFSHRGEDQSRWHQQLLAQAAVGNPQRPAVISSALHAALDELRKFRHFERNNYAHVPDGERVRQLVTSALHVSDRFHEEARSFMAREGGEA